MCKWCIVPLHCFLVRGKVVALSHTLVALAVNMCDELYASLHMVGFPI
jgi:hypothetical protein